MLSILDLQLSYRIGPSNINANFKVTVSLLNQQLK